MGRKIKKIPSKYDFKVLRPSKNLKKRLFNVKITY